MPPDTRSITQAADVFDRAADLQRRGHHAEALVLFDALLRPHPGIALLHIKRGAALGALKRYDAALESFDRAIALDPDNADAHFGKAATWQAMRRLDEALGSYDRVIALQPKHALALNNRGVVLREFGRMEDAIRSYDRAVALMPDDADFRLGKALCMLSLGNFAEGWPLFEGRKERVHPVADPPPGTPPWQGEALSGKTLLIQAEQGLGDTIQFCRFAVEMERRGARIVLQVQDSLIQLMKSLGSPTTVVGTQSPVPHCDYHVMLLSMPLMCGTVLETIPCPVPYLAAEPERVRTWKARLGETGFKIGIAWQGERQWEGVEKENDIGRSFPVNLYGPISRIPGTRLINLQKNDGVEQLRDPACRATVESFDDFDSGADAFLDTAAIMENLDLVITSDTAVAHLAGALGRPVWLALRYAPDWRWLLERETSPWYPTMRLFRQSAPGDWHGVFDRIESALRAVQKVGLL